MPLSIDPYLSRFDISRRAFLSSSLAALVAPGLPPALADDQRDPDSFTLIALPDTQNYSERFPHIYTAQTKWIRDNVKAFNIVFVAHEGDVTNLNQRPEWVNAGKSMALLDGAVPYSVNVGNHDLGPRGQSKDRSSHIDEFFPVDRYKKEPWWGGALDGSIHNSYQFFTATGMRFLVMNLEFAPRESSLEWADKIIRKHNDCRTILVSHSYMSNNDKRIDRESDFSNRKYPIEGLDGEEIWQQLVRHHEHLFLVLSGHIFVGDSSKDWKHDPSWTETGRLTSTNDAGRPTHQLLADYQGRPNGGEGWLRVMTFHPRRGKIQVSTYSPWLDKHLIEPHNRFPLDYAML